mmetsp:Transcript_70786/g.207662  ORF Transcript_70786/g.207662 Transcript_70786/m.207662 type:complete len:683 (+) Transcript_70786:137-2185(+)
MDVLRESELASMRDGVDLDPDPAELQLDEAVLVVLAVVARRGLRGDAATAAGDNPRCGVELVAVLTVVDLEVVLVPADEHVDAVPVGHLRPDPDAPEGREVRHDDLPVRRGVPQGLVQPRPLPLPEGGEPARARAEVDGALGPAAGLLGVVLVVADVVGRVGLRRPGVKVVGVHEEVLHREVLVVGLGLPVLRGRQPAAALAPRVGDGLVPAPVEHPAAVVVVPEDAEPGLPGQALPGVDLLPAPLELGRGRRRDRVRGKATLPNDAAPVEVVADVQDVVRARLPRPELHLPGDALLRLVVDPVDEVALAAGELLGVSVVCGRDPVFVDDAAPVADDEDGVAAVAAVEAGGGDGDAVQVVGPLAGLGGDERVRAQVGALARRRVRAALLVLEAPLLHLVLLVAVRQEDAVPLPNPHQARVVVHVLDQPGLRVVLPRLAGSSGVAPHHRHVLAEPRLGDAVVVAVARAETDAEVVLDGAARLVVLPELVRDVLALPRVGNAVVCAPILGVQADARVLMLDAVAVRRREVPLLVGVVGHAVQDHDLHAHRFRVEDAEAVLVLVGHEAGAPVVEPLLPAVARVAGAHRDEGVRAAHGAEALPAARWPNRAVGPVVVPALGGAILAAVHVHLAVRVHREADPMAVPHGPRVHELLEPDVHAVLVELEHRAVLLRRRGCRRGAARAR